MKNGTIGTIEKRELAKLVELDFTKTIGEVTQQVQHTESDILEIAKRKLGVALIEKEIQHLKNKQEFLSKKLEQLGFKEYSGAVNGFRTAWKDNRDVIEYTTPAGRLYYSAAKHLPDVRKLEEQKADVLKSIWLSDERKEVTKLVNTRPCVKALVLAGH